MSKPNLSFRTKNEVIDAAQAFVFEKIKRCKGNSISCTDDVRTLLRLKLALIEQEVFGIILLNNTFKVISIIDMFYGTINSAQVYPREIIKTVLKHNAAGVIFYHNHPSGNTTASESDIKLTNTLKELLNHLNVRVLDHFIVCGDEMVSFSTQGLL